MIYNIEEIKKKAEKVRKIRLKFVYHEEVKVTLFVDDLTGFFKR